MALTEQAREKQRQYAKQWRAKNRDKVLNYQRGYYRQNIEKFKAYQERYWNNKALEAEGGSLHD